MHPVRWGPLRHSLGYNIKYKIALSKHGNKNPATRKNEKSLQIKYLLMETRNVGSS